MKKKMLKFKQDSSKYFPTPKCIIEEVKCPKCGKWNKQKWTQLNINFGNDNPSRCFCIHCKKCGKSLMNARQRKMNSNFIFEVC